MKGLGGRNGHAPILQDLLLYHPLKLLSGLGDILFDIRHPFLGFGLSLLRSGLGFLLLGLQFIFLVVQRFTTVLMCTDA